MKTNKNSIIFLSMNFRKYIFYILFLSIIYFSKNATAHELWLEPKNFRFDNKSLTEIEIKIGQNFEGSAFGYYEPFKKKLYIENDNEEIVLEQRDGNFPAIQTLISGRGLHIFNYETNFEQLKYDSIEKFVEFLEEHNLQDLKKLIDKDKLPSESYKRFAKVLLNDGSKNFFVQKPKLDFEIIALNSPFDPRNDFFELKLFKNKKPLANFQVTVFSKDEKNTYKDIVKTNPNGVGKLRLIQNRTYLLSSVFVEKNNYLKKIKQKSDWSSEWASFVFKR